jgi:hypothetical protein
MRLFRWLRRHDAADDSELDERTREENEKFRAQHDGMQGRAQPAADRWQRRTDNEFKPPSY